MNAVFGFTDVEVKGLWQKENVILVVKKGKCMGGKCVRMGILYAKCVIYGEEVRNAQSVKHH